MSPLPRVFRPQLATLVKAPPEGDLYLHEIKYDGYRIGCRIESGRVTLLSRNGLDWTDRFPEIRDAAARLPLRAALLDGEVAMVEADGRTSFQALQNAFGGATRDNLVFFAFDLLFLDGVDVSRLDLDTRKARLATLLGTAGEPEGRIRYSSHVEGDGAVVLSHACALGLEGIVSKRRDEPYRPGRHSGWLKAKCIARQEFVIGGFTDPEGSRQGIGALLVGYFDDRGRLVFAGKVGTGFTERSARELRTRLDAMEQAQTPFTAGPRGWLARNAHWVEPELVTEVTFTEWTSDGKVRHPSFQGLRTDKPARDIRRERPFAAPARPARGRPGRPTAGKKRARRGAAAAPAKDARSKTAAYPANDARPVVAGVGISHPDRLMFSGTPVTKLQLARYYEALGDWILPHLRGRPLTLVRCPDGATADCFYMKHSKVWAPAPLRRVNIREKTKIGEYLVADELEAVVALVQMNVLEVHTWNSRVDHVEQPDRLVFDIDPGPKVTWRQVIDAATLVRSLLDALALRSFVKTTGGRGLHVVVPITPGPDWSQCLAVARGLAELMVRDAPRLYTTNFAKAGRQDKILVDFLRNNRTNTSVAAYSTRARPGGPVSVPLRWEELTTRLDPSRFTVETVGRRLGRLRADPWAEYWTTRQHLSAATQAALATM